MKIYACHSRDFDYQRELYLPLRQSVLNQKHEIILPHETSEQPFTSKEVIPSCEVILAEVSVPSTSLGIEIGWGSAAGKRIIFLHKTDAKISRSLAMVSTEFVEYLDSADLIQKLEKLLK